MQTVDEIGRWSEELARDPSSRVFLHLADALRRGGQLDVALKIALRGVERHQQDADAHDLLARVAADAGDLTRACEEWQTVLRIAPDHVGAMKGLGFVSFQEGRLADAERYLSQAEGHGGGADVSAALAAVRRSAGQEVIESAPQELDAQRLFAGLLTDDGQTALLLDAEGLVLAGLYLDPDGTDVGPHVGAQLSGISDEVVRATRHLDLGQWRSMVFETQAAVVAMAPVTEDALVIVAASRATPLGLLRRLLTRCVGRAGTWLRGSAENVP